MSQHYSASQFDEPFKPVRLNNYSPFTNKPVAPYGTHAMCLPTRCGKTQIIADDKGKLFDCICRGPSSPWGDYSTSIWEKTYECCCINQLRHPLKYCCDPRKHIFISKTKPRIKRCKKPVEQPCPPITGCCFLQFGNPNPCPPNNAEEAKKKRRKSPAVPPLEIKRREQEVKKQIREEKKLRQVMRKQEIDYRRYLRRLKIAERASREAAHVDLNFLRKNWSTPGAKAKKNKGRKNACPSCLYAPCCRQQPGQPVFCKCLFEENALEYFP